MEAEVSLSGKLYEGQDLIDRGIEEDSLVGKEIIDEGSGGVEEED